MERPPMAIALNPWDHAAGVLVVQEAGGVVELMDGRAYAPALLEGRMMAAHSRQCLEQVRDWYAGLAL
ncbi:MAG: inositol monophosphatase family protein [Thiolinea sp.]